jgi:transposase
VDAGLARGGPSWRAGRGTSGSGAPTGCRRRDAAGAPRRAELLSRDPQAAGYAATGWTVPLLPTEVAKGGWQASGRTIRRTLHRLGWVWKRPRFVLGRPAPARSGLPGPKGAVAEQAGITLAAGGEVWFGDETTLRAYPPLRAAWAKRGAPANVVISGRNGRRVLHGARNAATGELVQLVRERRRQDDCLAFVEELGRLRPEGPKLLIGDNAPPHHPQRVLAAAARAHITSAWLPFRAPELNPCEDRWRLMKAVVAANRCAPNRDELAQQAVAWLAALSPYERLRCSGLLSIKFQWLSTYASSPLSILARSAGHRPNVRK